MFGMSKLKSIKAFNLLYILLSFLFFSCEPASQAVQQEEIILSPLETVRLLAEENKQFENIPSRSSAFQAPEIKAILDRGYIVFAMVATDQKPYFYIDEKSGELIGVDVELAYAIANRLGVRAVFNRNPPTFDGVVMAVINKEADIALSKLSRTIRRAELVRFTNPYMTFRQALLINRLEYARFGSEEQLPYFIRNYRGTLGVIINSSYHTFAFTNFPNAEVVTYPNWSDAVDALFNGEVLALYRDEGEILIVNNTRKDASLLMKPVFITDKIDPIAMAVSRDAPLLQEWLNIFLDDYMLQNQKEMTPSWFIERHFSGN